MHEARTITAVSERYINPCTDFQFTHQMLNITIQVHQKIHSRKCHSPAPGMPNDFQFPKSRESLALVPENSGIAVAL